MDIDGEASYIDYEAFLDPAFSPIAFANTLVTSTNNASDTPIDLSTPLSRVLFDVQEIDSHIHTLTTRAAVSLLTHASDDVDAAQDLLLTLEAQLATLNESYHRLENDVFQRHADADEVQRVASRLWDTVKLGRVVTRCLLLGRQLEGQMVECTPTARNDEHRAMIRAATTLLSLRRLFAASDEQLMAVHAVQTLQTEVVTPAEQRLRMRAQQLVREFSLSALVPPPSMAPLTAATPLPIPSSTVLPTYAQTTEARARTTSACLTLYLLGAPNTPLLDVADDPAPPLLLAALQAYLHTALTASVASLGRALAALTTLQRTLAEISARCQNIVALEALLAATPPPALPASLGGPMDFPAAPANLLLPLLDALDTSSLPSFFWRSLASGLAGRVAEIMSRGGASTRTLRAQRVRLRETVTEAVLKGVEGTKKEGGWEREVGVMVGSILGGLDK